MPGTEGSIKLACCVSEVIGNSPEDFAHAINEALNSFAGVVGKKNIHGVDVLSQKIQIDQGEITNYRVVCKIAYDGAPL